MARSKSISVLGAGSWGTALAILIARNGHDTLLWGHAPDKIADMQRTRCNDRYLPGIMFPEKLRLTAELGQAAENCDTVLVVVPSHAFSATLQALKKFWRPGMRIAWATKGFDPEGSGFLHSLVQRHIGTDVPMAVASGPTFAKEVAADLPTAITIAANDQAFADELAGILRNPRFRAYTSHDMIGVEIGGAVKNVLAIAAGVADGLGFGANTRAALVTRGIAEIRRLGLALGAEPETFLGLAGIGDLVLTCTDNQSRNRRFGLGLGGGQSMEETRAAIGQEVEGIAAARHVVELARRCGIEMPICEQTYAVLYKGLAPEQAVRNLLERDQKPEIG